MSDMTVQCLHGICRIHSREYEMLSGFMSPNDLIAMAHVPSFEVNTTHRSIADSLTDPPVDNWQRPLDTGRLVGIRTKIDAAIPGDAEQDSLMANPVLIGRSDEVDETGVNLEVNPYTVSSGSRTITVPGVFNIQLSSSGDYKPLWILDGQHRIHGLGNSPRLPDPNGSRVADELIPVVFIVHADYTPRFLAKIFTEVTTEAQKLDDLHGDWMQYAFDMGKYSESAARNAMAAVVQLSIIQNIDSMPNEFAATGGQIKFNPEREVNGVGPLKETAKTMRELIESEYYRHNGTATDVRFATAFVRFYRAARDTDSRSNSNSKLMGSSPHSRLVRIFFSQFLNYLASDEDLLDYSESDWVNFLVDSNRQFGTADWSLPDVGGTQSNEAHTASRDAAEITFHNFFRFPNRFQGDDPANWMVDAGPIDVQTAQPSPSGRFPNRNYTPRQYTASGGTVAVRIRTDRHTMVRFRSIGNSQSRVVGIRRRVNNEWIAHPTREAIILVGSPAQETIRVITCSYGDSSIQTTEFRFTY